MHELDESKLQGLCKTCAKRINCDDARNIIWCGNYIDAEKIIITCFKCHGKGTYPVPIDPDYSWDECEQHECNLCKGTGKITLEAYEWFQGEMRDKKCKK